MNSESEQKNEPTIGLALGGGGMRALAHIGILKVLEREGIHFDFVAGTSMGGIVAAAYANGMHVDEMEQQARNLSHMSNVFKLMDWSPGFRSLMQGQNIYNYLGELLGADLQFADLAIPLVLTAVDLNSWQEVVLSEGNVIDAVRATIAIPGVIAAFEQDGQRLIDGGFLNNVPADLARQLGADIVVAVDVGIGAVYGGEDVPKKASTSPLPNFMPPIGLDLWQINAIMIKALTEHKLRHAAPEVLIMPKVATTVGMLSGYGQIESVIQAGYDAAEQALPRIRAILPASHQHVDPWTGEAMPDSAEPLSVEPLSVEHRADAETQENVRPS